MREEVKNFLTKSELLSTWEEKFVPLAKCQKSEPLGSGLVPYSSARESELDRRLTQTSVSCS